MESSKSRDQSLYDYLECLQLEYIVCELRRKIYSKRKDKDYYQRTMDRKTEKINDIAGRNRLPTIFTDAEIKERLYEQIYPEQGYPRFVYSDSDREELEEKDCANYYRTGAEVRVQFEDSIEVGVIEEFYPKQKIVHVRIKKQQEAHPYTLSRVTRIL